MKQIPKIALTIALLLTNSPAFAQSDFEAKKRALEQLSLNQLPPIQNNIYGDDGELIVKAGTAPEDFLTPYDMGWENLTINDIQRLTGEDVTSLPVSSFPGLYEYISEQSKRKNKQNQFALLLKPWKLLESPALAQTLPPPSAVVPINSLPGVGNVQIQTISGPLGNPNPPAAANANASASGSSAPISVYPALSSIPILSTILSIKDYFVPVDVVYAGGKHFDSPCKMGIECKEAPTIDNAASGTWKKAFIPCTPGKAKGDDCAHIEVRRTGGEPAQIHIRWMSKLQKETEGNFICTKGPVGRHPFGPNPRVVIENLKENGRKNKKAEVEFALYFYVKGPPGFKSANCFGPVPLPIFGNVKEGDLALFGLDNGKPNSIISSIISGVQNPGNSYGCNPGQSPSGGGTGQPQQFQQASQSDLVPVTTAPHLNRTEYLHRDAASAFEEMLKSARATGVNLYALSGYRSIATQQQVQAANPGSTQIAAPGQSEHHTGYAVDISNGNPANDLNQSFESTSAYKWLKANAAKFGFVQSYGAGSQYGNEPWHWRWQGNSTAQQVFNNASSGQQGQQPSQGNCGPSGNLPAPMDCPPGDNRLTWPARGTLTDGFGWSPWRGRMHLGQDIAAPIGTPIVAANCGRVVLNRAGGGFGNWLILAHADGSETFYTHMNAPSQLPVGTIVKRGQYIGPMGTSGFSTGPHIHFQYERPAGNPVDPMKFLP